MSPKNFKITVVALLALAGMLTQYRAHQAAPGVVPTPSIYLPFTPPAGYDVVTRVVDGDTIEVDGTTKVRYLGMDTPETVDPRKPVQCFGHEASDYNHKLVEGKFVRLVRDVEDTDKYGRLLRYVYLQDGTFVNLQLVAQGYARTYTWPPNIAHTQEFVAAEQAAKAAGLGRWSACAK